MLGVNSGVLVCWGYTVWGKGSMKCHAGRGVCDTRRRAGSMEDPVEIVLDKAWRMNFDVFKHSTMPLTTARGRAKPPTCDPPAAVAKHIPISPLTAIPMFPYRLIYRISLVFSWRTPIKDESRSRSYRSTPPDFTGVKFPGKDRRLTRT